MKVKIVTLLIVCCLQLHVDCQSQISEFEQFVQKFGKVYATEEQYQEARRNFESHLEFIESFNKGRHRKFRIKLNRFADLNSGQKASINGFKTTIFARVFSKFEPTETGMERSDVPDVVDWRDSGVVTPVQDQGYSCGACWAFSTAGCLESAIAIRTKRPAFKLSEQQFIDCNFNARIGNYGCDGGFMTIGLSYALLQDITTGFRYPYVEVRRRCTYSKRQARFSLSQPIMLPAGDEEALKVAVATHGPVAVAIDASLDSFFAYSSGVYYDPLCTKWLNHAMLVVGYGTDPTAGDFWIIKNSWGDEWGEDGYVRLARNRDNHCGISQYAVYVKVN